MQPERRDFRVWREGAELVAEWPGYGRLRANRSGTWSEFIPAQGVDALRIEKFRRGLVRAFLRHLQGGVTLHGSAVARGERALACLGLSGSGKSTAAAELCSREGVSFVADDAVALELMADGRIDVVPNEGHYWLLPDAAAALSLGEVSRKSPLDPPKRQATAVPLVGAVELVFDDSMATPRLERLRGSAAFMALASSLLRFVVDEPDVQARDFDHIAMVAATIPVYELRRPRRLDQVRHAGALLLGLLQGEDGFRAAGKERIDEELDAYDGSPGRRAWHERRRCSGRD